MLVAPSLSPSHHSQSPSSALSNRSSHSPPESYSALPPTPPQSFLSDPLLDGSSFFNFAMLDEEFSKGIAMGGEPFISGSSAPYDFMSSLPELSSSMSMTSESSPSAASNSPAQHNIFTIDPQLVGSPSSTFDHDTEADSPMNHNHHHQASSNSASSSRHNSQHPADNEADNESDDDLEPDLPSTLTIKVGGKGKAGGRKGTVASGGITKKSSVTSSAVQKREQSEEPDEWRPSPEEYKKMSSKEKRQLRNKISARNFRIRRKEYITTLEGDIAERDRLLEAIRSELGSTKDENRALRQEVDALKKALLSGRAEDGPVLPPPAPLPAVSAALTSSFSSNTKDNSNRKGATSPAPTPNTRKDLPTSPRLRNAGAFWGGGAASPMAFGGYTPVHTTLVPEISFGTSALSGKPTGADTNNSAAPARLQENLNPALNSLYGTGGFGAKGMGGAPSPGFDAFAEMNPFTLKTLDAYRMQLWTKMAAQQHARREMQQQQQQQTQLSGLASNLRPAFFASKHIAGSTGAGALSGKAAAGAYPTPPTSPRLSPKVSSSSSGAGPSKQEAAMVHAAALASQSFMAKLGSAFWDAFAGHEEKGGARKGRMGAGVDADKVRRVLEGKAVLRVVDVEPQPQQPQPQPQKMMKMGGAQEKDSGDCLTTLLEESMRSLSISKKGHI
ncbi:hypothetical protein PUNSTDRAFT_52422 [Punctularia strigosozonata HHB-11173 SS5]|uniref:uncharacterized protein n=1 Tax=Punctularia strigosozonata (strain HHB-11173) TaxID=741275 RepID=UPI00044168B6|nr:uncharacterized protein PUNSTDRAFT_52422 [Punctularia strigosozonata HHB-11173 SS5]EIN09019.1 hypothetical protein PUNSTDRAFT_52422 [Punctularia strigosozonata HHB-11173 SS5]